MMLTRRGLFQRIATVAATALIVAPQFARLASGTVIAESGPERLLSKRLTMQGIRFDDVSAAIRREQRRRKSLVRE